MPHSPASRLRSIKRVLIDPSIDAWMANAARTNSSYCQELVLRLPAFCGHSRDLNNRWSDHFTRFNLTVKNIVLYNYFNSLRFRYIIMEKFWLFFLRSRIYSLINLFVILIYNIILFWHRLVSINGFFLWHKEKYAAQVHDFIRSNLAEISVQRHLRHKDTLSCMLKTWEDLWDILFRKNISEIS